jgi:hypothetical protein
MKKFFQTWLTKINDFWDAGVVSVHSEKLATEFFDAHTEKLCTLEEQMKANHEHVTRMLEVLMLTHKIESDPRVLHPENDEQ